MDLPATATVSNLHVLQSGSYLYRVHDERFNGNALNPCMGAATRFTHLHDESGDCVPTSYAATTLDGAAYETVFRGIPNKFQAVPRQQLDDRIISIVRPARPLRFVPLFTPELKAWGIDPMKVFAPSEQIYDFCRALGSQCWRDNPMADGMIWPSVQDSGAQAMLLFGDRLLPDDLGIVSSRCVRTDPTALDDLESAGSRAGWSISK